MGWMKSYVLIFKCISICDCMWCKLCFAFVLLRELNRRGVSSTGSFLIVFVIVYIVKCGNVYYEKFGQYINISKDHIMPSISGRTKSLS